MINLESVLPQLEGSIAYKGSSLEAEFGFSSDLMSDVLALCSSSVVLITGLNNLQTLRTAEMAGIEKIIFVRNKKVSKEMLKLAQENNISLIETPFPCFELLPFFFKTE